MLWELVLMFTLIVSLVLLPVALIQHKNSDSIFIANKPSNSTRKEIKDSASPITK